eukprot:1272236-Prymnesium_polylepis.1
MRWRSSVMSVHLRVAPLGSGLPSLAGPDLTHRPSAHAPLTYGTLRAADRTRSAKHASTHRYAAPSV